MIPVNVGDDLSITPTLATDFIKVQSSTDEKILVELYSLEGSLLYKAEKNSGDKVDIGFLPDGYYVIKVRKMDQVLVSKFLKSRVD